MIQIYKANTTSIQTTAYKDILFRVIQSLLYCSKYISFIKPLSVPP